MSNLINIAGTEPVIDPNYRYKMPPLERKIEGRGNGIKTVLPNLAQVAQALHRTPQEITKCFGVSLGAQSRYGKDERAIVNGEFSQQQLDTVLSEYIEEFVLCPNCRQPEVPRYKVKKGEIRKKCLGCGYRSVVNPHHKLCTFILQMDKQNRKERKNKTQKHPAHLD